MRISDWSSDVCSSDLKRGCAPVGPQRSGGRQRRCASAPTGAELPPSAGVGLRRRGAAGVDHGSEPVDLGGECMALKIRQTSFAKQCPGIIGSACPTWTGTGGAAGGGEGGGAPT